MDLSLLTIPTVIAFLLILTRISGMLVSAPLLNMNTIPPQVKIGLAFTFSIIIFPFHTENLVIPHNLIQLAVLLAQELILGLLLGFMANLVFTALQMAGEFISFQMGLSISSVLDPVTGVQLPTMGQLYFYFAALIFLSLNIHHALIVGVNRSFQYIPLGNFFTNSGAMAERFVVLTSEMFILAVLIAIPVMGILLITEVGLGFMAKVMPQMNIFMVGLPLKVAVGILVFGISLPYVANLMGDQYAELVQRLIGFYRVS